MNKDLHNVNIYERVRGYFVNKWLSYEFEDLAFVGEGMLFLELRTAELAVFLKLILYF